MDMGDTNKKINYIWKLKNFFKVCTKEKMY